MKIIIDIDKDTYIKAKTQGIITDRTVVNAIANGMVLYDKVSLKLKGKGYVLYNYDWLKEHIDMESKIIKGER